ncbi:MAG: VUT family protein [Hyphomonadaceae bacterium]
MDAFWNEFVKVIAARDPAHLPLVLIGLIATGAVIWYLKGRAWAYIYVALIPLLNWSFGRPEVPKVDLTPLFGGVFGTAHEIIFNPLTIATGMVFVVRDFVQREMGHKVLALMALAIAWSFYYSYPAIALASGIAFAISETSDWLLFTFTKYRLSTRIWLSSALAAPIDTTVFLFGADLAQQGLGHPPGEMFNLANWVFFIIGKMIGAVVVSMMIRNRERRGEVDPAAA